MNIPVWFPIHICFYFINLKGMNLTTNSLGLLKISALHFLQHVVTMNTSNVVVDAKKIKLMPDR